MADMRMLVLTLTALAVSGMGWSAADAAAAPSSCAAADPTRAPATITGFDSYTAVNVCDYPGPKHYGWSSLRFKTTDDVHCELYDGPNSWQYYASITCWGKLPGVPAGVTQVQVASGSVASFGQADAKQKETQNDGHGDSPVDPGSYRQLAAGQKIVVAGAKGTVDENDEVCAMAADGALTCEIQNPGDGWGQDQNTHGFVLSAQGSRVY
ncbi:hypothetical protein BOO86_20560 [Mycobacterium sp. CBMA 234]|nr:hypothetical protein [Mycolicibacterium sp. CBMA 234]